MRRRGRPSASTSLLVVVVLACRSLVPATGFRGCPARHPPTQLPGTCAHTVLVQPPDTCSPTGLCREGVAAARVQWPRSLLPDFPVRARTAAHMGYYGAGGKMDKRLPKVDAQVKQCYSDGALVLLDGDNLRAAFGWRLAPETLIAALSTWAGEMGFAGRTILTFDHGRKAECGIAGNLAVCTAGPRGNQSADDAIAKAAAYFAARSPATPIMLVSSDRNLAHRLRLQSLPPPQHPETSTGPQKAPKVVQSLHFRALLEAGEYVALPNELLSANTGGPGRVATERGDRFSVSSVSSLTHALTANSEAHSPVAACVQTFVDWWDNGCIGLMASPATRRGLILYSVSLSKS